MARRFETRRDSWLMAIIYSSVFLLLMTAWSGFAWRNMHWSAVVLTAIGLGCALLLLWVRFGTYYVIADRVLHIYHGPYRWRIPLDQIEHVAPTRSCFSSPALSMERVKITYGGGKTVMISPERQQEFLLAVSAETRTG
ncbi:MAG: PH domain-containing protein [Gammaproteobacteria bacterium]|nr:PH domain-containing protein [Gammaproteobacteria bacterium]NNF62006.1 PH domain-containing protein [Gammaproteobacteria bacterium]NNM20947.1 PH domain-containing protein [Gammaproteobacteria bacterium]